MQNDLISRSKLLEVLEAAAGTAPEGQVQTAMLIREKLAFATGVVKQAEAVDAVPVVRCKECKHRGDSDNCPLRHLAYTTDEGYFFADYTLDDSFCSYAPAPSSPASIS